eukprot:7746897-Pyramimonas_sp.AAC.1
MIEGSPGNLASAAHSGQRRALVRLRRGGAGATWVPLRWGRRPAAQCRPRPLLEAIRLAQHRWRRGHPRPRESTQAPTPTPPTPTPPDHSARR